MYRFRYELGSCARGVLCCPQLMHISATEATPAAAAAASMLGRLSKNLGWPLAGAIAAAGGGRCREC